MNKLNLINVQKALDSLKASGVTKADLSSLGINSLKDQVGSISSAIEDLKKKD